MNIKGFISKEKKINDNKVDENKPIDKTIDNSDTNIDIKTNIISNKLENATKVVLEEIEQKEKIIAERKRKFVLIVRVLGIVGFIIIILFGALGYQNYINEKNKERTIVLPEPESKSILDISDVFVLYNNNELKLNIRYPDNVSVNENKTYNNKVRNIEITYSPNNGFDENNELTEGFIVRITPLELSRETLDQVAEVKRESFYRECGVSSQISKIRSDVIDNGLAKSFDVRNCNGDFKVSYTSKFGVFYEIIQLFRGNLGFIQQYRIATEDIVSTISFYAETPPELDPFIKYESRDLSFSYPREFKTNCCNIPSSTNTGSKLIEVGVKDFQDRIGAIALFANSKNEKRLRDYNYDQFVADQKLLLISDYKIVNNGVEPVYSEEKIVIGDREALRLRGISWQNNDVIFISTDENVRENNFYSLSIVNQIGPDFEETVKEILESFEFDN